MFIVLTEQSGLPDDLNETVLMERLVHLVLERRRKMDKAERLKKIVVEKGGVG